MLAARSDLVTGEPGWEMSQALLSLSPFLLIAAAKLLRSLNLTLLYKSPFPVGILCAPNSQAWHEMETPELALSCSSLLLAGEERCWIWEWGTSWGVWVTDAPFQGFSVSPIGGALSHLCTHFLP